MNHHMLAVRGILFESFATFRANKVATLYMSHQFQSVNLNTLEYKIKGRFYKIVKTNLAYVTPYRAHVLRHMFID